MKLSRYIGIVVLLVAVAVHAADETRHIVLLHVNDSHGQTMSSMKDGKPVGGYPRLASAVEQVRQEVGAERVLLIHAGDDFSRGDAMTSSSAGAANIAIMNQIGFSLMVPGNGEFYPGVANLQKRISEAKFPVLASNVRYRIGDKPLAKVTEQFTVDGVRVGVMGLCFLRKEHPSALPLAVEEPVPAARRIVPELRKANDVVLAVNHIGIDEDRALAAAVSGIDVIIGGHTHTTLPRGHWVTSDTHSTFIAQAGDMLRYVGRVDVQLVKSEGGWHISDITSKLIPLDGSIPEDPSIKATIARLWPTTAPASAPAERAPAMD